MPKKPRLGPHLEWHGNDIRVTVSVPPSMVKLVGSTKLKASLGTSSPQEADILKWPVIARLKQLARGGESIPASGKSKLLVEKAMRWREAIATDPNAGDERAVTVRESLIETVLPQIAAEHGEEKAVELLAIADGRATPLTQLAEDMASFKTYPTRTKQKLDSALRILGDWCAARGRAATLESFDVLTARTFLGEAFKDMNPATARDIAAWYGRYWRWCGEDSGHFPQGLKNPWERLATKFFPKDHKRRRALGYDKQPFTDDEVGKLFANVTDEPFPDFMRVAAFSGMRAGEIARITVGECADSQFFVSKGKTVSSIRRLPIHPALNGIVARRCEGKEPGDFLFEDLPGNASEERGRYAVLSQRFTRRRRELGIGETVPDSQQDTKDFHSFRRWFIKKAVEALLKGAVGFSPWTIARVVGHEAEDGDLPLGMTMSRYPGDATEDAKKACVAAVRLPCIGESSVDAS